MASYFFSWTGLLKRDAGGCGYFTARTLGAIRESVHLPESIINNFIRALQRKTLFSFLVFGRNFDVEFFDPFLVFDAFGFIGGGAFIKLGNFLIILLNLFS